MDTLAVIAHNNRCFKAMESYVCVSRYCSLNLGLCSSAAYFILLSFKSFWSLWSTYAVQLYLNTHTHVGLHTDMLSRSAASAQ
jgi:hypothetical protein